jgi:hypothetical protein
MAPHLGITEHAGVKYPPIADRERLPDFFPPTPLVSPDEWQSILSYYAENAAPELPSARPAPPADLDWFEVQNVRTSRAAAFTTFLRIDAANQQLWSADAQTHQLLMQRVDGQTRGVFPLQETVTWVDTDFSRPGDRDFFLVTAGNLHPHNGKLGKALQGKVSAGGELLDGFNRMLEPLERPVYALRVDLDGDGVADPLVCSYGNLYGDLAWWDAKGSKHQLWASPGAIHCRLTDENADGLPDIWCLFAQAKEQLVYFKNLGKGEFEPQITMSFPATTGSSWFLLEDVTGDAKVELIISCGDNADYSREVKPWHGIHIYEKLAQPDAEGQHFQEQAFLPMFGCTRVTAADFDGDGDKDLATIAQFPDFRAPAPLTFQIFRNDGAAGFTAHLPTEKLPPARWLVMDAGDLDGDTDIDIALGNFCFPASAANAEFQRQIEQSPGIVVLRNRGLLPKK